MLLRAVQPAVSSTIRAGTTRLWGLDRDADIGNARVVSLPMPHPAFSVHFVDPIYEATAVETAPFGSDEGADILWECERRRQQLNSASTVAEVMETDDAQIDGLIDQMAGIDHLDQAASIRAAAFALLRLTGHLGDPDRSRTLRVLDYEIRTIADPTWLHAEAPNRLLPPLHVQRRDLASWANPSGVSV